MGKILVTGVAGFIGSWLAKRLVDEGDEVIGIDCFTPYYSRKAKEMNLKGLLERKNFSFIEGDLLTIDMKELLRDVKIIFHEAAQAGVRTSWGKDFKIYTENNIIATQRLMEALKEIEIEKFIFASSSSVYGDADTLPMKEDSVPLPISPYGVTKLSAENLCHAYFKNSNIPVISLRYFTVYGPGQRPDMAFHRFIEAILKDRVLEVYGDGIQTRDFTYISDIVDANMLAKDSRAIGEIFNIGGGARISINRIIEIIENIADKKAKISYTQPQKGDVKDTYADTTKARMVLGFSPKVPIEEGIKEEFKWLKTPLVC